MTKNQTNCTKSIYKYMQKMLLKTCLIYSEIQSTSLILNSVSDDGTFIELFIKNTLYMFESNRIIKTMNSEALSLFFVIRMMIKNAIEFRDINIINKMRRRNHLLE